MGSEGGVRSLEFKKTGRFSPSHRRASASSEGNLPQTLFSDRRIQTFPLNCQIKTRDSDTTAELEIRIKLPKKKKN